jgi:hypothetical protein
LFSFSIDSSIAALRSESVICVMFSPREGIEPPGEVHRNVGPSLR